MSNQKPAESTPFDPATIIKHENVHAALAALQAECPHVFKTKKHAQGYSYATLENWIDTVGPLLAKHGLVLVVSYGDAQDVGTYETKSGTWHRVRVEAHADLFLSGRADERIVITAFGEGSDPADKAVYKAMTGARKYLYAALSGAMTSDDPEYDERDSARKPAAKPASAPRTSAPAAKPAPAPRGPEQGPTPDGVITIGQARDCWKLFRERVKQVAPGLTKKEEIEHEFRLILKAVAGVESTKAVPARLFTTFVNVIKGWKPEGHEDPNWSQDPDQEVAP